ncbi:hypothetical protein HXA34_04235 [Salipaludibacillus agaradhaerens]|uniref:Uncharacterized protein n=1 Tax=Salipaludibacillus agaradhaerens TaxID=76935 RepID=A0A9Q4G0A2_SALAG|nr:hypothetical protein [Salipaludibacillus agaradhaerens]MCR6097668.1 hypothetical protein [Salipaludibacillus agaradhaerens]MCR6105492.1 hypothetical protein [Salipaludibacillus agaradhaerens]MCR6112848.1 hypothetical protein [Salipaludibacillus agaradhaerens]MCR6117530.1 hypothetical protein [Salipaludibacillus agaradhaerens]
MSNSTVMKFVSGGFNLFFCIPVISWVFVVGLSAMPLFLLFILHLVTFIFSLIDKRRFHGSVVGMTAAFMGWIPVLGFFMHVIATTLLIVDGFMSRKDDKEVEI